MYQEQDYRTYIEPAGKRQQEYFWILATAPNGRPVILGAYATEDEANRVGLEKIKEGTFEVVPLKTRDAATATKCLKYRRFHQTAQLEEALKRAKHQV